MKNVAGCSASVVAEVHGHALAGAVSCHAREPDNLVTGLFETLVFLPGLLLDRHPLEPRIEHVEGEQPTGCEMLAHAPEASELVVYLHEVLEGAERRIDGPELLSGAER